MAKLAYRVGIATSHTPGIRHLTIEILSGAVFDAARQYSDDPSAYRLERMQTIRAAGDSTRYFETAYKPDVVTLCWQTDAEAWEARSSDRWYACRIDAGAFTTSALTATAKLHRKARAIAGYDDIGPQHVLQALRELRAVHVCYVHDTMSAWSILADYDPAPLSVNPFADNLPQTN